MKQLQIHRYSKDFSGLRFVSTEPPVLSDRNPVLIRIKATSLNPVDIKMASGESKALAQASLPLPFGVDFCGVVEQVHGLVPGVAVGDRVIGYTGIARPRAFAEWIAVSTEEIAVVDSNLPFEELGAIPLTALTAYQALKFAELAPGARVLIHGAGGGVGSMAVQMAKRLGAEVFATASPRDFEWLRSLGVNRCVDFKTEDFAGSLNSLDFVLDTVGGSVLKKSIGCLRPGGALVSISAPPTPGDLKQAGLELNPVLGLVLGLLSSLQSRRANRAGIRFKALVTRPIGRDLAAVAALVRDGVRARVGSRVSFPELGLWLSEQKRAQGTPKFPGKTLVLME